MPVIFVCDGCGKQAPGHMGNDGHWQKPAKWFERSDDDGGQLACSRECIEAVAEKTGKTAVVLPW